MSRMSNVVLAGVLVALVSACSGSGGLPDREVLAAYSETVPPAGETVTFYALTHCGVEHARIGGHWWTAQEPLSTGEGGSAPPGWDDPYQQGRLTLESASRAVFRAHGEEVVFQRNADDREPPGCR